MGYGGWCPPLSVKAHEAGAAATGDSSACTAVVAGFAAFGNHLTYLPFSGSLLGQLADELQGYTMTKSSLHFSVDRPLPKTLVKKLIAVRLQEIGRR